MDLQICNLISVLNEQIGLMDSDFIYLPLFKKFSNKFRLKQLNFKELIKLIYIHVIVIDKY